MIFETAVAFVLQQEGGYSDDPADHGGATRYGVTEIVAHEQGYRGEMRDLSLDLAKRIYRKVYWDALSLDKFPERTAIVMFDSAVSCGPMMAATWLQKSLNILGAQHLDVDGAVGPKTLAALWYYSVRKGESDIALSQSILAFRSQYYLHLAECDISQRRFIHGWLSRIAALGAYRHESGPGSLSSETLGVFE